MAPTAQRYAARAIELWLAEAHMAEAQLRPDAADGEKGGIAPPRPPRHAPRRLAVHGRRGHQPPRALDGQRREHGWVARRREQQRRGRGVAAARHGPYHRVQPAHGQVRHSPPPAEGAPSLSPPHARSPPPPLRSPRIQSLSLELGCGLSSRGVPIEDSWKGEILPDFLFLGDRVTASDLDRLTTLRITHILNCTEDVSNFFETSSPHLRYLRIPVNDRSEAAAEMASHFPRCVEFLDECRACGGRALVHCRAGVSRSATIVIGYLMQLHRWDLKSSLHYVDKRRFVQPNSGFIQFLVGLEKE